MEQRPDSITPESRQADVTSMMQLLDGATAETPALDAGRQAASDPSLGLEERLEAYEDIIDSEVGDTSLVRSRNLEREIGLRQVYLKFEGGNPSGTQKDRIAYAQVLDAMRRGFDAITVATCGNFGGALALAAHLAGLRCIIYLPVPYHSKRLKEIEALGAEIIRAGEDYETAVEISRQRAEQEEFYDANPGGANTLIQFHAYSEIAYEIYDDLRDAPAAVAVPVSNGTTLAGIHKGFVRLHRRGKTSRIPKIIAGSSFRKNPIVSAFLGNLPHCVDLEPRRVRETVVNEPLINWHAIDGEYALQAVRETAGWAENASDKDLLHYSRLLRGQEGLNVLPASTAGLVALVERHGREPLAPDRYVVVLTGRRA